MKTYNQLDAAQKEAAFNYHLNTMIEAVEIEDNPPDAKSWANHDAVVIAFTPHAQAKAETFLYGDDDSTGILPVMEPTAPKEELDKAFFLGQYENSFHNALDKAPSCAIV